MSKQDAQRPVSATNPSYARGLLERVLLVPCPRCGAGRDERCIGAHGKRTKSRHYERAEAAAAAGYVMGRLGNLARVRQLHHELLAASEVQLVRA